MLEQTKSENNSLKQSLIEHEKSILGNYHFTKFLIFGNLNLKVLNHLKNWCFT